MKKLKLMLEEVGDCQRVDVVNFIGPCACNFNGSSSSAGVSSAGNIWTEMRMQIYYSE